MMTQQLNVSILAAPLAAIDRRALSQAWFSALHLARDPAPTASPQKGDTARFAESTPNREAQARRTLRPAGTTPQPHVSSEASSKMRTRELVTNDRRAPRTALTRKIERTFLNPPAKIKRATFAIGNDGARVHVVLQSTGARVRLVAFCPPRVRENVARALEQARYALAARGIAMDLETADAACS
jgi:hypothetical protein